MSSKKMWLPAWAAKIAGLSSLAQDDGKLIEPGDLSDGEKKAIALETGAATTHEICRCPACGGAMLQQEEWKADFGLDLNGNASLIDFEKRRCVRCGQITKGVAQ